jgi:hypothetical protein
MTHFLGNCRTCHYPLVRLPEPRCPECGTAFDPSNPETMDFNRPLWARFFERPNTPGTWVPAVVLTVPALLASIFLRENPYLAAITLPAIIVLGCTLYVVSARRGLRRRLQKWAVEDKLQAR